MPVLLGVAHAPSCMLLLVRSRRVRHFLEKILFLSLMLLKHITRVNAGHIMCTQYELNHDDFNSVLRDPTLLTLVHVLQSIRKVQCYRCSTLCDCAPSLSRRMTKLLQHEECETYVRDDVCTYCSEMCLISDTQGVLDGQTHIGWNNSVCE